VGAVVLDLNDIEQLDVNALGGEDTLRVEDLTGTGVGTVAANLAGELAGPPATRRSTPWS